MARNSVPKPDPGPPVDPDEYKRNNLRQLKPGQLTALYLECRRLRQAARVAEEEQTHNMELVGDVLFEQMDALGQDGFTSRDTSVYSYTLTTARAVDPSGLRELVLSDPEANIGLIDMRASLGGVREWMANHAVVDIDGNDITPPPDGVEIVEFRKLGVRRK
jgi:hypothetical protein